MLLYFILGIAFYGLAIPIAESIISLFCTYIEYLKGKIQVKMVKLQEEIEGEETTYAIGFDTDCYVGREEDEEEWEDDE